MYRVLIADDEQWGCEALIKIIRETAPDFRVECVVHDGLEALHKLEEEEFDLIITDIRMPNKDGLGLIRDMAEAGITVPVIILSGYNDFEYARTAIRYGVFEYLLKPINRSELSVVLERLRRMQPNNTLEERKKQLNVIAITKPLQNLPGPVIIKQIEELIRKTYYEDHYLAEMGRQFDLNPAYLGRLFRAETGIGFIGYLQNIRIEKAKQLLTTTMMSIAKIGHHVGYWDDKHFIKIFKKATSLTPSEYRSSKRGPINSIVEGI
ncbi:response regulator transcription factor [Paenibacillus antarcticus]|uniref:DNA-binding response regulator n=1 Tax=Paenibacillus antarcticus TaxID=253703 RepID=A0A168P6E2_9BACL|nr:response regulator [Paenibacillus antarcticus]OAB46434.1 hypothetical protein PBAT_10440 [Paenibacillus antarcticus]